MNSTIFSWQQFLLQGGNNHNKCWSIQDGLHWNENDITASCIVILKGLQCVTIILDRATISRCAALINSSFFAHHNQTFIAQLCSPTHFFFLQQCVILVVKVLVLKLPFLSFHGLCRVLGVKLMSLQVREHSNRALNKNCKLFQTRAWARLCLASLGRQHRNK